jgi:hypothetical protein
MRSQFGNVTMSQHPARLRITEPKMSFWRSRPVRLAIASEPQLAELRKVIANAFQQGNGVKEAGLFPSRKLA